VIEVKQNIDLMPLNTFRLPAKAHRLSVLTQFQDIPQLLSNYPEASKALILGGGSNLILTQDVLWVLQFHFNQIQRLSDSEQSVVVRVGAGVNWHQWVQYAVKHQWFGLENLTSIPGSVGAAPIQNIGAYGVEVGSCIQQVLVWDKVLNCQTILTAKACQFGYRNSIFKQERDRYWVLAVDFVLSQVFTPNCDYPQLKQTLPDGPVSAVMLIKAIDEIRANKLPNPIREPNAGSFFHNPIVSQDFFLGLQKRWPDIPVFIQPDGNIKISAGFILEKLGWKGREVGHFQCHPKHALVLVHLGGGTGLELLSFAQLIQENVLLETDLKLMIEPLVV
jgi:UDP-N-acetylmuramate dehydrogenase